MDAKQMHSWEGYVDGGEENDQLLMAREEEQEGLGILPLHIERSRMAQCDAQQHALIKKCGRPIEVKDYGPIEVCMSGFY